MNKSVIAIFSIITLTLVSCRKQNSERIDQSEIWSDFRVVLDMEENQFWARAAFKHLDKNGEALRLGDEGSIIANGNELPWSALYSWYESQIDSSGTIEFDFTDNDENNFKSTITITEGADYNLLIGDNDSLVKGTIQFVPWDNCGAIQDGEIINLVITQDNNIIVVSNDTIGSTGVYIPSSELNVLKLGEVSAHFEKWVPSTGNYTAAGGISWFHYISKKETVKIVD